MHCGPILLNHHPHFPLKAQESGAEKLHLMAPSHGVSLSSPSVYVNVEIIPMFPLLSLLLTLPDAFNYF